jgi:hypothetical protein
MFDLTWLYWAPILILQNFAFTFVSRARNSGSINRHIIAAIASNGVWFISSMLIFSKMFKMMTGDYGKAAAFGTAIYYTAFTVLGSVIAHYWSLRSEKGKAAVGANAKYAQIPVSEWEAVKGKVGI